MHAQRYADRKAQSHRHFASSRRWADSDRSTTKALTPLNSDERLRRTLLLRPLLLHITGTVEPIPTVTLESIFYPTDYPDKKNPRGWSRQEPAAGTGHASRWIQEVSEYDPDAKLSIEAHADDRASKPYNQDLSERRVERIKGYLVDRAFRADKVETAAYGKDQSARH